MMTETDHDYVDGTGLLPSLGLCSRCHHRRYEPLCDYPAWMSCQCAVPDYRPAAAAPAPAAYDDNYVDC